MSVVTLLTLVLAAAAGTLVVVTRDVRHQAIVFGLYGLVLALVFVLLQAPDVALAQAAVSGVLLPLLVLIALAKLRELDR
jgi:energy-converting hydrogenase B subunit D